MMFFARILRCWDLRPTGGLVRSMACRDCGAEFPSAVRSRRVDHQRWFRKRSARPQLPPSLTVDRKLVHKWPAALESLASDFTRRVGGRMMSVIRYNGFYQPTPKIHLPPLSSSVVALKRQHVLDTPLGA